MKTLKITLPLALLLLTLALPVAARPGGGPGPDADGPGFGPRLEKLLDLTEAQSAALTDLREKHRGENVGRRKELRKLQHQIDGLLLEDAPDAGALEKLIRKAGDLKTEMKVEGMRHRLEMRKLLTPEQRDRLLLMKPGKGGPDRRGARGRAAGCDGPGQGRSGGRGR